MIDRIGKFEISKCLGRGSMGEVYLGRDTVLGREVAIKTISAGSSLAEEARTRFAREAQATAAMNHPHIVTVYDFGEVENQLYLVMELVEGKDFQSFLDEKSMTRSECLEILAQISDALAYTHEHGIIHRDVKPSNILVTKRGQKYQAKLTDFGVALISASSITQQGTWMGTVSYMAPEYLDSGKASCSSDLFAVGVMLYESLTGGKKPFMGETTTAVLNAILRSAMRPLKPEERVGLPLSVLAVLKKSLARQPESRYSNGEQLAEALREAKKALDQSPAPPQEGELQGPAPSIEPPSRPSTHPKLDKPLVVGKGPRATCLSLRVALRQAKPGSVITILPGVHRESLLIDKDIALVGEGEATEVILESTIITHAKVRFSGLTLKPLDEDTQAICHVQGGSLLLEKCKVESHHAAAIQTGSGTSLTLQHCDIQSQADNALELGTNSQTHAEHCQWQGQANRMIEVGMGASLHLAHCTVNNQRGIGIVGQANCRLELNDTIIAHAPNGGIELRLGAQLRMQRGGLHQSRYAGLLAFESSRAQLEECDISGHSCAGIHAIASQVHLNRCKIQDNLGYGITVMAKGQIIFEDCDIRANQQAGLRIGEDGSAQLKGCRIAKGLSLGLLCAKQGRGVLESCEIAGNAQSGAKVEPGGSLLLVKCHLRDGQDTGLLLFEDAEATLEECVVHRNARGGILLARDATDPQLRGDNQIQDHLVRMTDQGPVKVTPLKQR